MDDYQLFYLRERLLDSQAILDLICEATEKQDSNAVLDYCHKLTDILYDISRSIKK